VKIGCALAVVLLAISGHAGAQRLLEFPDDLAFSATEVNALAARAFGARLRTLAGSRQLDPDPALGERLKRIFPRLLRAAIYERPAAEGYAWEIHACRGCEEHALAMPGGKVLVSADFVRSRALTDGELAYLLAHEIGHVLAEHTRAFATAARYFADNGLARDYGDLQQELDKSLPLLLRMRSLSVQQELEADYIGFILGAHAGYAPESMLSLLEKLRSNSTPLVGTHPADDERLQRARAMLETARRLAARAHAGR